jgi:hypothetical protein
LIIVLGVLMDIYVTMFLYACSDETSMLGHTGYVCIMWSRLVACIVK